MESTQYCEINDTENIQRIIKYIFRSFHAVCEENGLIYNMFGGTMLGAVRHQDMIPWDDDIDVTMPREDYDKLDEFITKSERLYIKSYHDKNYIYPYKKVCLKSTVLIENPILKKYSEIGAYIDIFPADGYPANDIEVENRLFNLRKRRGKMVSKCVPSKVWWKKLLFPLALIKKIPYLFMSIKKNLRNENELLSKTKICESDHILLHGANWGRRGKIPKSVYFDRRLYPFGDFMAYGISDYDAHLTNLYGDYMQLPPEEKRVSNHNYRLFVEKKLLEEITNGKQ